MTTVPPPMCFSCARRQPGMVCAAFPKGIPEEIMLSQFDHRKPFKGDHGLQYVRADKVADKATLPENIFAKSK